jgi:hypothetical protein
VTRDDAGEAGAAGDVGDGEAAAAIGGKGFDHVEAALQRRTYSRYWGSALRPARIAT